MWKHLEHLLAVLMGPSSHRTPERPRALAACTRALSIGQPAPV
jgi:hypothetical protein